MDGLNSHSKSKIVCMQGGTEVISLRRRGAGAKVTY